LSGSGAISLKSLQCCDEQFVWLTFVTCGYHAVLPVKGHIMHFTGSGFVEHETKKTDEMTKSWYLKHTVCRYQFQLAIPF